jgi:endonuclease/exonuclease/phosphatase family metal-dependent hydrolase
MSQILKVATYNIRKCIGNDRKRNPHRTLEVLNEIDADIIALQEADRRFGTRESCLSLELLASSSAWEAAPLDVRPQSIGWHGNAILLRRGIKLRHAAPLHLPMLEPRGAVVAELTVNGRDVRVIGVHLDLSGLWRRRQVRWLLAYLDAQPRHMPTIIMGDFNQWSDRGALSEFAFHHHRILKTPKSFHATRPVAQLDRIIVSHDVGVSDFGAHASPLAQRASDHLPIWAELTLP